MTNHTELRRICEAKMAKAAHLELISLATTIIALLDEIDALKAMQEAAQDLIDSLDAYPEQLVPINRLSHTCRMLREALAKVEGK